jgi:hypothetical protein
MRKIPAVLLIAIFLATALPVHGDTIVTIVAARPHPILVQGPGSLNEVTVITTKPKPVLLQPSFTQSTAVDITTSSMQPVIRPAAGGISSNEVDVNVILTKPKPVIFQSESANGFDLQANVVAGFNQPAPIIAEGSVLDGLSSEIGVSIRTPAPMFYENGGSPLASQVNVALSPLQPQIPSETTLQGGIVFATNFQPNFIQSNFLGSSMPMAIQFNMPLHSLPYASAGTDFSIHGPVLRDMNRDFVSCTTMKYKRCSAI